MIITINMLSELSKSVLQYLAENNYSVDSQEHYRGTYNQLLLYLMKHRFQTFDIEIGKAFIRDQYGAGKPTIRRKYYASLLRRLTSLLSFTKQEEYRLDVLHQ